MSPRQCAARNFDDCERVVADTGAAYCPEPLCERDFTRPTAAEAAAWVAATYPADAHADANWCAMAVLRVLEVVAAHEAAAEGQPLGWAADIRNAIEGDA